MKDLNERVAVITGAASGIGQSVAQRCAQEGMRLVLADIDETNLDAVVGEITSGGGDAIGVVTDVRHQEQIQALADKTIETYGKVNLVHNNAGVVTVGPLEDLTLNDWEWTLGVNLWSCIFGTTTFLPLIKEAGEGHIVNTSSSEGLQASGGTGAYNVSKFGIIALTQTLARELKPFDDINASVLCPGPVRTKIVESERHRPEELLNGDGFDLGLLDNEESQGLLAGAMDPAIVADMVISGIKDETFWLVTHDETKEAVMAQATALVKDGSLSKSVYDFS
jgi:NAD(P)-dependent dehydrogenase (short-subunit alcohol dehydrogenase family)